MFIAEFEFARLITSLRFQFFTIQDSLGKIVVGKHVIPDWVITVGGCLESQILISNC